MRAIRAAGLGAMSLLLLVAASGRAASTAPARVRAFARLPDWSGIWQSESWFEIGGDSSDALSGHAGGSNEYAAVLRYVKLLGRPPYNPEWERRYEAIARNAAAISAAVAAGKMCTPPGFPFAMESPSLFQVAVLPEQTLFVFDSGAVRYVYTDDRSHPAPRDLWPTRMGDSIGHWEGETLVIDTIERTPGPMGLGPSPDLSERAHFIERVRMIHHDILEDRLTIEDPLRFTRPWKLTLRYRRVKELDRMITWDCDNDRNPVVNGKLVIAPP